MSVIKKVEGFTQRKSTKFKSNAFGGINVESTAVYGLSESNQNRQVITQKSSLKLNESNTSSTNFLPNIMKSGGLLGNKSQRTIGLKDNLEKLKLPSISVKKKRNLSVGAGLTGGSTQRKKKKSKRRKMLKNGRSAL